MPQYNQKEIERYNNFIKNIYDEFKVPKEFIDKTLNIINVLNKKNIKNMTLPAIYGNGQYHDEDSTNTYVSWNFENFVFYFIIDETDSYIEWFSKDRISGQCDGGLYDFEDENMWSWLERCQNVAPDNACLMY